MRKGGQQPGADPQATAAPAAHDLENQYGETPRVPAPPEQLPAAADDSDGILPAPPAAPVGESAAPPSEKKKEVTNMDAVFEELKAFLIKAELTEAQANQVCRDVAAALKKEQFEGEQLSAAEEALKFQSWLENDANTVTDIIIHAVKRHNHPNREQAITVAIYALSYAAALYSSMVYWRNYFKGLYPKGSAHSWLDTVSSYFFNVTLGGYFGVFCFKDDIPGLWSALWNFFGKFSVSNTLELLRRLAHFPLGYLASDLYSDMYKDLPTSWGLSQVPFSITFTPLNVPGIAAAEKRVTPRIYVLGRHARLMMPDSSYSHFQAELTRTFKQGVVEGVIGLLGAAKFNARARNIQFPDNWDTLTPEERVVYAVRQSTDPNPIWATAETVLAVAVFLLSALSALGLMAYAANTPNEIDKIIGLIAIAAYFGLSAVSAVSFAQKTMDVFRGVAHGIRFYPGHNWSKYSEYVYRAVAIALYLGFMGFAVPTADTTIKSNMEFKNITQPWAFEVIDILTRLGSAWFNANPMAGNIAIPLLCFFCSLHAKKQAAKAGPQRKSADDIHRERSEALAKDIGHVSDELEGLMQAGKIDKAYEIATKISKQTVTPVDPTAPQPAQTSLFERAPVVAAVARRMGVNQDVAKATLQAHAGNVAAGQGDLDAIHNALGSTVLLRLPPELRRDMWFGAFFGLIVPTVALSLFAGYGGNVLADVIPSLAGREVVASATVLSISHLMTFFRRLMNGSAKCSDIALHNIVPVMAGILAQLAVLYIVAPPVVGLGVAQKVFAMLVASAVTSGVESLTAPRFFSTAKDMGRGNIAVNAGERQPLLGQS